MMHPTLAGIGLVRLGDSGLVPANPEDDLRGKEVYDPHGQRTGSARAAHGLRIGCVEELYVDRREREVRSMGADEMVLRGRHDGGDPSRGEVTIERINGQGGRSCGSS